MTRTTSFALRVLPLLGVVAITTPFAAAAPATVAVEAGAASGADAEVGAVAAIVVTGTRAGGRLADDTIQAVDVISSEQLASLGTADVAGALNRLLASVSVPRPHNTVGSEAVRPLVMRGLAPDQVLVLVNGKRRNQGAFLNTGGALGRGTNPTDLAAIPVSAIERIEVLRDGASARYGSDAIAGVINIILKSQADGGSVNATFGRYKEGDGYRRELQAHTAIALGSAGALNLALEGQNNSATNRAGADTSPEAALDRLTGQITQRIGAPALQSGKFAFNGEYRVSDALNLYAFGTLSRREAESYYSRQRGVGGVATAYPNGFLPTYQPVIEDQALVVGSKGQWGDWRYDLSLDWGRNEYSPYIKSFNTALYNATRSSPTDFYNGTYESSQLVANFNVARSFELGLVAPVSLAFGIERQSQRLKLQAGDPASWFGAGALAMPGISPLSAGAWRRHSLASYIDVEGKLSQELSVSLAARHERYSDFGSSVSGSLAARYDFNRRVALRAAISNGFRAPTLTQQYYSSIQTQGQDLGAGVVTVQSGAFAVDSPVARLLGARDLKPEKSRSQTLGLVLRPSDALSLTLDGYRIEVRDRINLSSSFPVTSTAVRNYLQRNGITDANYQSARYMTNAADTTTTGLDVSGEYRWKLANGDRARGTLTYGYNRSRIDRLADSPAILTQLAIPVRLVERREIGQLTDTNPRQKLILGGDYTLRAANLDLHASVNRFGAFSILSNTNASLDQRFKRKWTLDVSASHTFRRDWRWTVGVENLTNIRPDRTRPENNTGGSFQYTSYSPLSADGAFYYTSLNYSW
ncbi:MAG: TonB-dependent receptor [Duganella sp.]